MRGTKSVFAAHLDEIGPERVIRDSKRICLGVQAGPPKKHFI